MDSVYNYLNDKLSDFENIVVAISGGPDSMALLDILLNVKNKKNINIIVAHVNHNVRCESADEAIFVEEYCKKNNLIFEFMKIDSYSNNKFSEVEARKKRYDFFELLINKYNSKYLLTAHHGDDLIETVLMRIVRGSSIKGYSGFSKESVYKNFVIIRPLISVTKEDILNYLDNNNLEYVIDKSNYETTYTRNRYRKYILPYLKKENKDVHLKFEKFSKTLSMYDDYIKKVSKSYLDNIYYDGKLELKYFKDLDFVIKRGIISLLLERIFLDNITLISENHIDIIVNLIENRKDSMQINLPNNIIVSKEYGYLKITNMSENVEFCMLLKDENKLLNGKIIKVVKSEESDSNFVCRLSKNEVKFPLYIRNKKNGDRLYVKGMDSSKKISDIFINSKISKSERLIWPVVVDSNDTVVWIPGLKKSKFDRTKDEKYDIILKYY